MSPPLPSKGLSWILWFAATGVIAAGALGAGLLVSHDPSIAPMHRRDPMLIAPMVGVSDTCIQLPEQPPNSTLEQTCTGPHGSAGALLEASLQRLDAPWLKGFSLGYTLPVPLMQLFRQDGESWVVDDARIQRVARTIRDSERPLILYFFSTHFSSHSALEKTLARDPANIAQSPSGSLPEDSYYGAPIYNWSLASTDNSITRYRALAFKALADEICKMPAKDMEKIKGITMLGELHQLFPAFETGMGFSETYAVTDYSPLSISGFQNFLRARFVSVEKLNRVLNTHYTAFNAITPPAKNIRKEALKRYEEHIDSFAHGTFPVSGWLYAPPAAAPRIHVYVNGKHVGLTTAHLTRRDVLEAKPAFGHANTGWRLDVDFRRMQPGLHGIDVYAELTPNRLTHLGHRQIAVMDRQQRPPLQQLQRPLPPSHKAGPDVEAAIDQPLDQASLFYNPLVPLWHEFRELQIVAYLRHFDRTLRESCLSSIPRYTHQLMPHSNPSWDANKFAVDASLANLLPLRTGVSLYGEASYGASFHQWLRRTTHSGYGITEFHPLMPMTSKELQEVFSAHATQGASFLSFFLEPYWDNQAVERSPNLFSFDPRNTAFGSNALYEAMRAHPTLSKPLQ